MYLKEMNDIKALKDQQREKHPGFDSYLECMSRTLFTGLASFWLGFSGLYFSQKIINKTVSYPLKYNILISALTASVISYKITSNRTKRCQAIWMATEDKHTALSDNNY